MSSFSKQTSDEYKSSQYGKIDTYNFPNGSTLCVAKFDAGWSWDKDMKPYVKTDTCQVTHSGYCLSGSMKINMDNGQSFEIVQGDIFYIEPGHVGQCKIDTVMLDFHKEKVSME